MIPGEIIVGEGDIDLNAGRETIAIVVANRGDRPIQVGSHYHFAEVNAALDFDRAAARGCRLAIAPGTAVRFEPGQSRTVALVAYAGARRVYGFSGAVMGPLEARPPRARESAPPAIQSKASAARSPRAATTKVRSGKSRSTRR